MALVGNHLEAVGKAIKQAAAHIGGVGAAYAANTLRVDCERKRKRAEQIARLRGRNVVIDNSGFGCGDALREFGIVSGSAADTKEELPPPIVLRFSDKKVRRKRLPRLFL